MAGAERVPRPRKFMQVLAKPVMGDLEKEARRRGIGVQQLIRAVVIPEWQSVFEAGTGPEAFRVYLLRQIKEQQKRKLAKAAKRSVPRARR